MKNFTNKVKVASVFAIALMALVNVVNVAAKEEKANLFIGNLAKEEISELIISPSAEHYPDNRNCIVLDDFKAGYGSVIGVVLPDYITEADVFDIEIIAGGKKYVAKKGVKIDFSGKKVPTLYLSTTEKDLAEGIASSVATTAYASLGLVTTTSILKAVVPRAAGAAGAAVLTKAGFLAAIPKIGPIVLLGGVVLFEAGHLIYKYVIAPVGDLWVQVDYK